MFKLIVSGVMERPIVTEHGRLFKVFGLGVRKLIYALFIHLKFIYVIFTVASILDVVWVTLLVISLPQSPTLP